MNISKPILVGFVGKAGVGKTSTANLIAPNAIHETSPEKGNWIWWDHYWLSSPLYQVYNARTKTTGFDKLNRTLYELDDIVRDVMGRSIPYENRIELVYNLLDLPITNNADEKPRSFLQQAGDLFLKENLSCFGDFTRRKILSMFYRLENDFEDNPPLYVPIVSDIRQMHEVESLRKLNEDGDMILIKLEASDGVRKERLLDRDNTTLSLSETSHRTELGIDLIPNEWYNLTLYTDDLSLKEQAELIKNFIIKEIGAKLHG